MSPASYRAAPPRVGSYYSTGWLPPDANQVSLMCRRSSSAGGCGGCAGLALGGGELLGGVVEGLVGVAEGLEVAAGLGVLDRLDGRVDVVDGLGEVGAAA